MNRKLTRPLLLRLLSAPILLLVIILGFSLRLYRSFPTDLTPHKILTTNYQKLPELVRNIPGTETLDLATLKLLPSTQKTVRKTYKDKYGLHFDTEFRETTFDPLTRSVAATFELENLVDFTDKVIFVPVRVSGEIFGREHTFSSMQIELRDITGKAMHGPKVPVYSEYQPSYPLIRPTTTEPVPLGSFHEHFDLRRIRKITIRFIVAKYPEGLKKLPAYGHIHLDKLYIVNNVSIIKNIMFSSPHQGRATNDAIIPRHILNKLLWHRDTENKFFIGINYPWRNYGWDVGKNPYGQPENSGWSSPEGEKQLREDFIIFKNKGIEPVRIFLFGDLRTGLHYTNGKLTGFDQHVRPDIRTIIKVAGETEIKVILVLFDFHIADGKNQGVGEHPEIIFSEEKYNFLIHLMKPLLRDMNKWNEEFGNPVMAIDMMNEPENMATLLIPGYFPVLKDWFKDLANIIHAETDMRATLGSSSIVDMQRWWHGVGIDSWQFHFYKYMTREHDITPKNIIRALVESKIRGHTNDLIFCGETEIKEGIENMELMKTHGFSGIMFWSYLANDGLRMKDNSDFDLLIEWKQRSDSAQQAKAP